MKHSLSQKALEQSASIHTETIYEGQVIVVQKQTIALENEKPHFWDIVLHPGAVAMIPVDSNGELILIQQWRRVIDKIIYEIPAGTLAPNETPIQCAQRELQEEIGYKAAQLIPLSGFYSAPGFCNEYIHLFLAIDLIESSLAKDAHEAIDTIRLPLAKVVELIENNQIQDAKTMAGIFRYIQWLKHA